MTARRDTYWDELGVAWSAIDPKIDVIAPRLERRLRRQSLLINAGLVVGFLVSFAGLVLGAFTIWIGATTGTWNFVTRGMAIAVISMMLGRAVATLLPVRASDAARSLSEMLDFAIRRAERTIAVVGVGLYACLVAAVLGLLGTAIRSYLTTPPRVSPVIDLLVLAVLAAWLFFYQRRMQVTAEKLRAVQNALAAQGSE